MTASDAAHSADAGEVPVRVPPALGLADVPVRPMPRLGRGIVWSDIVAEIDRDERARERDAA
jgi:hypothetical protein